MYDNFRKGIGAFNECVDKVLSNIVDSAAREKVLTFHNELILQISPWHIYTSDGVTLLSERIFPDQDIRDYILNTHLLFSMYGGYNSDNKKLLTEHISDSSMVTNKNVSSIPKELHGSFISKETIKGTIETNPWLLTIFMLYQIGVKTFNEPHK